MQSSGDDCSGRLSGERGSNAPARPQPGARQRDRRPSPAGGLALAGRSAPSDLRPPAPAGSRVRSDSDRLPRGGRSRGGGCGSRPSPSLKVSRRHTDTSGMKQSIDDATGIYVQHSAINDGQELHLDSAPGVIGLRVDPNPCDVRTTETIDLRAGSGLLEIFNFNKVRTGPREELLWVRIGRYRRAATVVNRIGPGLGGQRVVLLLSEPLEDLSSECDLFDSEFGNRSGQLCFSVVPHDARVRLALEKDTNELIVTDTDDWVVSQFECRGFRKTRYTFAQRRATQSRVRRTPAQPPLTPCRQPRHHEPRAIVFSGGFSPRGWEGTKRCRRDHADSGDRLIRSPAPSTSVGSRPAKSKRPTRRRAVPTRLRTADVRAMAGRPEPLA